jgi:hypothetical protein
MASDLVADCSPPLGEGGEDGRYVTVVVIDQAGRDVDDVPAALGEHLGDGELGDGEEAG